MAVYTHLAQDALRMLVEQQYDIGNFVAAEGIAQGVSNSNYRVTVQGKDAQIPYILTLYEARTEIRDLPFFLELMEHLARSGIACPKPIPRRDGALYGDIAGKAAAMVSFLNGKSLTEISVPQTASTGETLAKLHLAGRDFPRARANGLGLAGWQQLYETLRGRCDEIAPGLETRIAQELDYLAAHWQNDRLPQGVIHADLFPDNVFFEGEQVSGVIDFYFACQDAWGYDLAITLNAWCFDAQGRFDAEKAAAMLEAYQNIRPLEVAEREAMPLLLRAAAMRFLMTRAHDWIFRIPGALVTPHDPMHYVRILEFHQQENGQ